MVDSVRLVRIGVEHGPDASKTWNLFVKYLFAMLVALCVRIFRWTSSRSCALVIGDMAVKHSSQEYQVGSKLRVFGGTV
jgi:hypothetical protein